MATYSEKLKDPRWQRRRLEILQRDNWACQYCEDRHTTLNVHHLEYSGDPWEVESDKLITLCEHCHSIVEHEKEAYRVIHCFKYFTKSCVFLTIIRDLKGGKLAKVYEIQIETGEISLMFAFDEDYLILVNKYMTQENQ